MSLAPIFAALEIVRSDVLSGCSSPECPRSAPLLLPVCIPVNPQSHGYRLKKKTFSCFTVASPEDLLLKYQKEIQMKTCKGSLKHEHWKTFSILIFFQPFFCLLGDISLHRRVFKYLILCSKECVLLLKVIFERMICIRTLMTGKWTLVLMHTSAMC